MMTTIDKSEILGIGPPANQLGLYQRIAESLQGRSRWLVIASFLYLLLFTVLAVVAAIQFFQAEAVRDLILYATAFLACLIVIAMLKLWYWMELNKNALSHQIEQLCQTLQRRNDT